MDVKIETDLNSVKLTFSDLDSNELAFSHSEALSFATNIINSVAEAVKFNERKQRDRNQHMKIIDSIAEALFSDHGNDDKSKKTTIDEIFKMLLNTEKATKDNKASTEKEKEPITNH